MHARLVGGMMALALVVGAGTAGAQAIAPRATVVPYAGYMVYGSYLDGPLGTSLRSAAAPVYGAQVALRVAPGVAIVGNIAHGSSKLEAGAPILGGIEIGKTATLAYDAGIELGFAGRGGVSPFVQLGAGAMRHVVSSGPVEVKSTNLAFNGGVGIDVPVSPQVGMRLMAKDYVGKFDFKEAIFVDPGADWSHNLAFSAGIALSF